MLEIKKKITPFNRTVLTNKQNRFIVIHYVGAVSTAKNNVDYFYSAKRGASANYFVDDNEIWQCVNDSDGAWHCGANKYYNDCRNTNSIGIEMCCFINNGKLDVSEQTIKNTIELTKHLMKLYNIPKKNVVRHYDVTRKNCPQPFVENEKRWNDFIMNLENEKTKAEKIEFIKNKCGFDENTMQYLQFYRFSDALIDKLYNSMA